MFNFFKRDNNIYSPIAGQCLDITECKDQAFASKMLGDGFLVIPQREKAVVSPCNGKVVVVFPTFHAVGIAMDNGMQILLHIGIDTVKCEAGVFQCAVSVGDKVKIGQELVRIDWIEVDRQKLDMSTMVVLTDDELPELKKQCMGQHVDAKTCIIGL